MLECLVTDMRVHVVIACTHTRTRTRKRAQAITKLA